MSSSPYQYAARLFKQVFNGQRNFFTPSVLEYGLVNGYAYEISTGDKLLDTKPYGVTLISLRDKRPDHQKSRSFDSQDKALSYVRTLV